MDNNNAFWWINTGENFDVHFELNEVAFDQSLVNKEEPKVNFKEDFIVISGHYSDHFNGVYN